MKTTGYILLLVIALSVLGCSGNNDGGATESQLGNAEGVTAGVAEIAFDYTEHDFGIIDEGEKVGCIFKYKNTGSSNLIIQKATGSCGCTVPRWDKEPTPPGKSGQLEVIFDSSGRSGKQNKSITVTSNSSNKVIILKIKADITSRES
ncbi:MAG: DUF1573 domain-containing protein [Bacteroidales bacterium]|nr:DUF1573 domain-containing protein [Bacteroidales bacterium]